MYGRKGTQEPAIAFNVGKPAATTLSSELQQQPLTVFQETQDIVKQRNGETHTRQKNIPCANFHFVSVFLSSWSSVHKTLWAKKISCFASFCHSDYVRGVVKQLTLDQK